MVGYAGTSPHNAENHYGSGLGLTSKTDVTGSRAKDTAYQNTSTLAMWVLVTFSNIAGGADIKTDENASPSAVISTLGSETIPQGFGFWVLPGHYYNIATQSGTFTISKVVEYI